MQKQSKYQKTVALFLAGLIMFTFSGCYTLRGIHKGEMQYAAGKYYYIHGVNSAYQINNVTISNGVLAGSITYLPEPPKKKDIVHIYVAPDSVIKKDGNLVSIHFENIAKAEINKVDGAKTVIFSTGIAVGTVYAVALIWLLAKGGSCPFIYSEDGPLPALKVKFTAGQLQSRLNEMIICL